MEPKQMKWKESPEERKERFKKLSSKERKKLIKNKLNVQGLKEGSGVIEKNQSSYDKEEVINLILLSKCFSKNI